MIHFAENSQICSSSLLPSVCSNLLLNLSSEFFILVVLACFLFSIFPDALISWRLVDQGETALLRVSQFLETVKDSPANVPFTYSNTTSPKHIPPTNSFIELLHSRELALSPNHPKSDTRKQEAAAKPRSMLKLFKLANLKPVYPSLPSSFYGNHNTSFCPCFPPAPSASLLTLVFPPRGPAWWPAVPAAFRDL